MKRNLFQDPVIILVGLGFPAEIKSVTEARAFLSEWPPSKQNSSHTIALKACKAALAREVDNETARGMFVAFAQRNDLLAPENEDAVKSALV
jgi:uncharacterized protein DUF982